MSTSGTRNFGLLYLDPSQSQPEIKFNTNMDSIDEALTAQGSITVKQIGDSPAGDAFFVRELHILGATVEPQTDGVALLTFTGGGGGSGGGGSSLEVTDGTTTVTDVLTLVISGAVVSAETDSTAVVTISGGGGGGGGSLTLTDGVSSVGSVDIIEVIDGQVVPSPGSSLLLHMDGSSGSTTFTDSSVNGVTITPVNGAAIETSNVMFGSGALAGTGGAYLTAPVTLGGALDLGSGDFTIEMWVYVDGGHMFNLCFTIGTYLSGNYAICYTNVGDHFKSNGSAFSGAASSGTIVVNTWHHIACVRHSGNVTMYLDGVGGSPVADTTSFSAISEIQIGGGFPGQELSGFIDEVRIHRATAAYTSNFTPPTAPFTAGGGTPGLATLRTNPLACLTSALPGVPYDGQRAVVTDASSPTFGSALTGGGSVRIPVYYDGGHSAWYVG